MAQEQQQLITEGLGANTIISKGSGGVAALSDPFLPVYRDGATTFEIHIDQGKTLVQEMTSRDFVKVKFFRTSTVDIQIRDYIQLSNGIKYYANDLPNIKKTAANRFEYEIVFESQYYDLSQVQFMLEDPVTTEVVGVFDLAGDIDIFIDQIVFNMNRVLNGWSRGTTDQTKNDVVNLHFESVNCTEVLQTLNAAFQGEFYFTAKAIGFTDKMGQSV